jgi:hypothetical protein
MYVELGNAKAKQAKKGPDGEPLRDEEGYVVHELIPGGEDRETRLEIPEGTSIGEAFVAITTPIRGAWANHSAGPPAWVESDSEALEIVLAEHFGCRRGRPKAWKGVAHDAPASGKREHARRPSK